MSLLVSYRMLWTMSSEEMWDTGKTVLKWIWMDKFMKSSSYVL